MDLQHVNYYLDEKHQISPSQTTLTSNCFLSTDTSTTSIWQVYNFTCSSLSYHIKSKVFLSFFFLRLEACYIPFSFLLRLSRYISTSHQKKGTAFKTLIESHPFFDQFPSICSFQSPQSSVLSLSFPAPAHEYFQPTDTLLHLLCTCLSKLNCFNLRSSMLLLLPSVSTTSWDPGGILHVSL